MVCADCVDAAANHPSPAVRSMLARSGFADAELLRRMALDPDIAVSAAAQAQLERAGLDLAGASSGPAAVPVWDGADW